MTLRDTWAAWLGPAADTITDDQLARLDTVAATIDARWPDHDLADDRTTALSAAAQIIMGDESLEQVGADFRAANRLAHERQVALVGALLASSTGTRTGPGSETDLIIRAGASRGTVRKALGR